MQMTDFSFLLYFLPIMLLGYFTLSGCNKAQNIWLVASSLLFYALGNYAQLLFLFALVLANYYLGYLANKYREDKKTSKMIFVWTGLINLLPLFFYRYLPEILGKLGTLVGIEIPPFPAVPLGISFLALQGISYVIDIHREKVQWDPDLLNSALYFTFFPPLLTGPIICYQDVAAQIKQRATTLDGVVIGLCRFVTGLAKVVLLAQPLLAVADIVFLESSISGLYTKVPVSLALLGLLAYALGLYHYLSGYSDLVIGLGKVIGLNYPENFNYPHLAKSVSTFWQRGYISLYRWFDEYVYNAETLSKKRINSDRMVLHTALMWLLIGIWIAPGLTKIIFGLWICFFIIAEKLIEFDITTSKSPWRHVYVLFVILISLIALKTDSVYEFTLFISNLFGMRDNSLHGDLTTMLIGENLFPFLAAFICSFPVARKLREQIESKTTWSGNALYLFYPVVMFIIVILIIVQISNNSYDPSQVIHYNLWRSI